MVKLYYTVPRHDAVLEAQNPVAGSDSYEVEIFSEVMRLRNYVSGKIKVN
jgi:hypothetical protein